MSQKIINVCDAHTLLDQTEVSGEQVKTTEVNYGDGAKLLELCGCEDDRSLKAMKRVSDELGREVEVKVASGNGRRRTRGKGLARDEEYKCRFCEDVKDSPQGRGMHEFRTHPWQRLLWEQETDYASNHPELEKKHMVSRQRRLDMLEEMGVSLERAAEMEKEYNKTHPHRFEDASIESSSDRLRLALESQSSKDSTGSDAVTVTSP